MDRIVKMPKLGVNMTDAQVIEVHVKEGDRVSEGQLLFTVETDKAVQEIKADFDGIVKKILVSPGAIVQCQSPIILFE